MKRINRKQGVSSSSQTTGFCRRPWLIALLLGGWFAGSAQATLTFTFSGSSSKNVPVSFAAGLSIAGDTLTVQLFNNSPTNSLNPDDTLSSFYFDIIDGLGARPTLTYVAGIGDVYQTHRSQPDQLVAPGDDLMATQPKDRTWQFRMMDDAQFPYLGFGIGTVGNGLLSPNNFNGNVVGSIDFAIYREEIITQSLHNRPLVRNTATFIFSGVAGFSEADIRRAAGFGLGTGPDGFQPVHMPEPGSAALWLLGGLATFMWRQRQRLLR